MITKFIYRINVGFIQTHLILCKLVCYVALQNKSIFWLSFTNTSVFI